MEVRITRSWMEGGGAIQVQLGFFRKGHAVFRTDTLKAWADENFQRAAVAYARKELPR